MAKTRTPSWQYKKKKQLSAVMVSIYSRMRNLGCRDLALLLFVVVNLALLNYVLLTEDEEAARLSTVSRFWTKQPFEWSDYDGMELNSVDIFAQMRSGQTNGGGVATQAAPQQAATQAQVPKDPVADSALKKSLGLRPLHTNLDEIAMLQKKIAETESPTAEDQATLMRLMKTVNRIRTFLRLEFVEPFDPDKGFSPQQLAILRKMAPNQDPNHVHQTWIDELDQLNSESVKEDAEEVLADVTELVDSDSVGEEKDIDEEES